MDELQSFINFISTIAGIGAIFLFIIMITLMRILIRLKYICKYLNEKKEKEKFNFRRD